MEADKLSQKNKASFPKACGVDKELKILKKANDEYFNFIRSKSTVEAKLLQKCSDIAEGISNKLNRLAKTRQWHERFDGFDPKEDGIEYSMAEVEQVAKDAVKKSGESKMDMANVKAIDTFIKHKQWMASKLAAKKYGDRTQMEIGNIQDQSFSIKWDK